jgi:hypothetical protein
MPMKAPLACRIGYNSLPSFFNDLQPLQFCRRDMNATWKAAARAPLTLQRIDHLVGAGERLKRRARCIITDRQHKPGGGSAPVIGLGRIASVVACPTGGDDVAGHGLAASVEWEQVIGGAKLGMRRLNVRLTGTVGSGGHVAA